MGKYYGLKESTKIKLSGFLYWFIEAIIAWWIWDSVILDLFPFLPQIAYWQWLLILIFLSIFTPNTMTAYLSKILDKLEGRS